MGFGVYGLDSPPPRLGALRAPALAVPHDGQALNVGEDDVHGGQDDGAELLDEVKRDQ